MLSARKKILAALIIAAIITPTSVTVFAAANDGWTEATQTTAAKNGKWEEWCKTWDTIKNSPVQMSLAPGKDATELNFSWYSKDTDAAPKLKIGKNKDLSDAKEISVTPKSAAAGFKSNTATATGLQENTTYYYSYQINGKWTDATVYKTQSTKSFSFLYVGDPQIGSSTSNTATGASKSQGQDAAVRNDSFNWNNTINAAVKANPNLSFILSAGDQIQTGDKDNPISPAIEIEYSGFLSPDALKSLPIATSIGNHDSTNKNYSLHFNNPNASNLGATNAGGDYYYSYGNALFIMLNTNNTNMAEHQKLIEQAISENPNAKWRIATVHHDIYGSGEHSNEPDIVNLRYQLIPMLENNGIDVVLTGHDHTYSRSLMLEGGVQDKSKTIKKDEFSDYFSGKTPEDAKYIDYLTSIEDPKAVQGSVSNGSVVDPDGILYMTADSASGSKYYELVPHQQAYIAARWQENVPTYSTVTVDDSNFTINTFRTDTGEKIDNSFSIMKTGTKVKMPKPSNTNTSTINSNGVKTGDSSSTLPAALILVSIVGLAFINRSKLAEQYKKLIKHQ